MVDIPNIELIGVVAFIGLLIWLWAHPHWFMPNKENNNGSD